MQTLTSWRGRVRFAAVVAAAALGLAMILAGAPATSAQSAPSVEIKQISLTPAQEVPPVTANAQGYFSGTLFDGKLDFDLSGVGPSLTMAHIHQGAKGANGPIVAFLFGPVDPGVGAIHPTGTITQASLVGPLAGNWKGFTDAMAKGELYANIHSTANPAGVMRAQLPPTTLTPLPPRTGTGPAAESGFSAVQGAGALLLMTAGGIAVVMMARRKA